MPRQTSSARWMRCASKGASRAAVAGSRGLALLTLSPAFPPPSSPSPPAAAVMATPDDSVVGRQKKTVRPVARSCGWREDRSACASGSKVHAQKMGNTTNTTVVGQTWELRMQVLSEAAKSQGQVCIPYSYWEEERVHKECCEGYLHSQNCR